MISIEQATQKVVAAISATDNNRYTYAQLLTNQSYKIYADLGMASTARNHCASVINFFIEQNGQNAISNSKLIKSSDTVALVINKTLKALKVAS